MQLDRSVVVALVPVVTQVECETFTLTLDREEMMTLRGLAWNSASIVDAAILAHEHPVTLDMDGSRSRNAYEQFLSRVWTVTNKFRVPGVVLP